MSIFSALLQQFDSKVEFSDFLKQKKVDYSLGENDENCQEFFSLEIHINNTTTFIGISSFGTGIKPSWLFNQEKLFVGYNDRVAIFDLNRFSLEEVSLLSFFWEFVSLQKSKDVCVICETAIMALSSNGALLWRKDTDLIESYKIADNKMDLKFTDDTPLQLDLLTGEIKRKKF